MKFFEYWRKKENDTDLLGLENLLQRNLVPVVPTQEFVAGLRKSLLNQIPQEVELTLTTQKRKLQTGLVITGGILGGVLVILSGVRGIISFVGIFALLINWFRQYSQHTPTAS